MPQLLVRKIEKDVVQKLRQKAALDGVSVEEEHRRILRNALLNKKSPPKKSFKESLASMPDVGDDADFVMPRSPMRKVRL